MHVAARLTALNTLLAIALAACSTGAQPAPARDNVAAPAERGAAPTAARATETPINTASAPARVEKVRVAETPAIAFAPVYVAEARGYFREQGIELDYEQVAGGADAVPLLARGDVDVNLAAISAGTFNAFERGLDI